MYQYIGVNCMMLIYNKYQYIGAILRTPIFIIYQYIGVIFELLNIINTPI